MLTIMSSKGIILKFSVNIIINVMLCYYRMKCVSILEDLHNSEPIFPNCQSAMLQNLA